MPLATGMGLESNALVARWSYHSLSQHPRRAADHPRHAHCGRRCSWLALVRYEQWRNPGGCPRIDGGWYLRGLELCRRSGPTYDHGGRV